MANKTIDQLNAPADDVNIRDSDTLIATRGGVTYKVKFTGALVLPRPRGVDSGKFIEVDATGNYSLQSRVAAADTVATLWSGSESGGAGVESDSIALDTGRIWSDYDDIVFNYQLGTEMNNVVSVPRIMWVTGLTQVMIGQLPDYIIIRAGSNAFTVRRENGSPAGTTPVLRSIIGVNRG